MADWSPKYGGNSLSGGVVTSAVVKSLGQQAVPEVEVPAVGDTVKLVAGPYSHHLYQEGQIIMSGCKIIELEVKAIKSAKIIFE